MPFSKNKEIKEALLTDANSTPSLLALKRFNAEKDTEETDHNYITKTVCAVFNATSMNDQVDFNIPLTDTSFRVTEFQTSDFTIWINFRLFIMSIGEGNGIPCEDDGIPGWIHHFNIDLAKNNTKWYENPACINIAKNQFIFIGYKNATDCFSQVMIRCRNVDLPETMTDNWALPNYLPNAVRSQSQRDNKRGSFILWENVQKHDPSVCGAYVSYWELWLQTQMSRNQQITISFPVVIKYDSLIFFENFFEYYNFVFGELELNVKVSPAVLVWCCVDPQCSLATGWKRLHWSL
jgi:hypothetical protein